jgi:leader peptidase (prepilin peptidase)/N-methyltransferase
MNAPLTWRLAGIAIFSLIVASQINRSIYRLAWNPRPIGPWSKPHKHAPPRKWYDRLPFIGWLTLEREAKIHGTWFWIRPLLIEVAFPLGMCALYLWETEGGLRGGALVGAGELHAEYWSHYLLLTLLTVATFIDIDEKTIPDAITIPGTLAGLILATCLPNSLLPDGPSTLWLTAPNQWQLWLHGPSGLLIGLLSFAGWCYALLPRTIWFRSGLVRGVRYLLASSVRHPLSKMIAGLWLVGSAAIVGVWFVAGTAWQGLLTSLVGIAAGGALVWSIRVAASASLGKEALGFGDVTLMGMIGSFFCWQTSILVFFVAPFAGVLIALAQFVFTRRPEIAFGPFLCAAALFVLLRWHAIWLQWGPAFSLGWLIPVILIGCVFLMSIMLLAWRGISGH